MKKALKELTILALILTMVLGVFALTGCESFDLAKYKETAKGKIDIHAATKVEANYCADNWAALCNVIAEGKAAVDKATTKLQVDTAVKGTNDAIDEVDKEENVRTFYGLKEAYDNDWLKGEDLEKIAYFHYNGNNEELHWENVNKVKKDYANQFAQNEMSSDDVEIIKYYGTYNGCVIVIIDYKNAQLPAYFWSETIGEIVFTYGTPRAILVYLENK